MKLELSKASKDIMKSSREIALSLGYDYISSIHFMLADIKAEGVSRSFFLSKNIDDFEAFIESIRIGPAIKMGSVPLTKEAEKAIKKSVREAFIHSSKVVEPCHIMLAALKTDKSQIKEFFSAQGFNYHDLQMHIKPQLITFRKFNDVALSGPLVSLLEKNGIDYELVESPMVFSASLTFSEELNKEYAVKIRPEDFDKVNKLLIDEEVQHIDDVDSDYYLFAFSNEELIEVVANQDEWNTFDVLLARKLLNERGVNIDEAKLKEQKIEEFKKPEKANGGWIAAAYFMALMGGILGLLIGWFLWTSKKTLPNGDRLYAYSDTARWHGKRIFIIGIAVFALVIWMRFHYMAY